MRYENTCPRCLEVDPAGIHTCSPTPEWMALEQERDALRAQVKKLEHDLAQMTVWRDAAHRRLDDLINGLKGAE